jgi:hypothetical protein
LNPPAENVHETELSDLDIFVREDEGALRGVEGLLLVDGVGLDTGGRATALHQDVDDLKSAILEIS